MKKIILLFILYISTLLKTNAQCFEIQSILVDACDGGNEGQNEMVTFSVGATPLNVADLTCAWPNTMNPWLGICQNTLTAAIISSINSSITACGLLQEPVGGVLPANSKVLLITSTAMNPSAQSFANLSETLTVIFQCPGNTSGHFANFNSSTTPSVALRTLTMTFSNPSNCNDAVTYSRNQLLNASQVPGAGDGGAVNFDAAGTPTYVNSGCAVPVQPLNISVNTSSLNCQGSAITLTSNVTGGAYSFISWTGGNGTFSNTTTTITLNTYTPSLGESGVVTLSATASRTCAGGGQTANTIYTIAITPNPTLSINTNSFNICGPQNATFVASSNSANSFTWSTGATTSSVSVSPTSTTVYSVSASNVCGVSAPLTVTVNATPLNTLSITSTTTSLCAGTSATITASSATGNYNWNTGATTNSIVVTPTATTLYSLTSTGCNTVSALQTITIIPNPTLTLNTNSFNICGSQNATITALSSTGNYTWSNGTNTSSIVTNVAGIYTVSTSNSCTNIARTATVIVGAAPQINLTSTSPSICAGQTATITLSGSTGTINWNTGETTSAITVTNSSVYTATLTNNCGTTSSVITIGSIALPAIAITPSSTLFCVGETATLSTSAVPLTYSLNWSGPGITPPINTNTLQVASGGIYTLSATDAVSGCSASFTTQVNTIQINPFFISNPTTGSAPLNVNFNNQTTGANQYNWNLGNGNTDNNFNSSAIYNTPGIYTVALAANQDNLCAKTYTFEITVTQGLGEVPEVFTPNGDNFNDFFVVKGLENYTNNELQIFNRWGNLVYTKKSYKNDWNGMPNAPGKTGTSKLPAGTYYVILNYGDEKLPVYKGFVQLAY